MSRLSLSAIAGSISRIEFESPGAISARRTISGPMRAATCCCEPGWLISRSTLSTNAENSLASCCIRAGRDGERGVARDVADRNKGGGRGNECEDQGNRDRQIELGGKSDPPLIYVCLDGRKRFDLDSLNM